MFFLLHMRDTIRITPQQMKYMQSNTLDCLRDEINVKYANKVIPNQGLVIALHSVLSHDVPKLFPGDGAAYMKTAFRLIVFRPVESEIVTGKVKQSTKEGIVVSLGFFDHILIPPEGLPSPSHFDESEGIWIWDYDGNDMYIDLHQPIRVRIQSVHFAAFNAKRQNGKNQVEQDSIIELPNGDQIISPQKKAKDRNYLLTADPRDEPGKLQGEYTRFTNDIPTSENDDRAMLSTYVPPLEIRANINAAGLGLLEWW